MPNWLENEERDKSIRDETDAVRLQVRQQQEAELLRRLASFYRLCERINKVRRDALSVGPLVVEGPIRALTSTAYKDSGGARLTGCRRTVRFGCDGPEGVSVAAVVTEFYETGGGESSATHHRITVSRTVCTLQDISDWSEDEILQTAQWIMNEIPAVGGIPGREICNAEGKLVVRLSRRAFKDPDFVEILVDGSKVGTADQYAHILERWGGASYDIAVGDHQLTVRSGDASRSEPIHIVASHATRYEVYFSSWNGIKLRGLGVTKI